MKITEIKEGGFNEQHKGHVVISPERLLQDNKRIINDTLKQLANAYGISIEDAAFALENALKKLSGGTDPTNNVKV